jgi:hypothetical protein
LTWSFDKWCVAVVDLAPVKDRLAKCIRLFGSAERANARIMTERALASVGASWTDLGDWIENSFSEDEMLEMVATVRKEEHARAPQSNGHIVLPEASEMAEYCHERLNRLKDNKQRDFVSEMYVITRRRMSLSLGRLGYLASIYIQIGGRI